MTGGLKIHPPIEGLLLLTGFEATLFPNCASKVAGLQVYATTPNNIISYCCYCLFNNNIFSLIIPVFKVNVSWNSNFHHTHLHSVHQFFFLQWSQKGIAISNFIEDQLIVKSNQIHGLAPNQMLTSKTWTVYFSSELCYTIFQQPHNNMRCKSSRNLED